MSRVSVLPVNLMFVSLYCTSWNSTKSWLDRQNIDAKQLWKVLSNGFCQGFQVCSFWHLKKCYKSSNPGLLMLFSAAALALQQTSPQRRREKGTVGIVQSAAWWPRSWHGFIPWQLIPRRTLCGHATILGSRNRRLALGWYLRMMTGLNLSIKFQKYSNCHFGSLFCILLLSFCRLISLGLLLCLFVCFSLCLLLFPRVDQLLQIDPKLQACFSNFLCFENGVCFCKVNRPFWCS